ncbi:MAG: HAAS signaling domain-containing protein, partial [Oscillospiraceae bacterium]
MAELSRLLAFMFKEDKEDILAKYNKMLDEAEDEQALLEEFGSPTKLAVTISRTYKREERKLSVEADSKEDTQSAPLEFGKKAAEEPAAKEPEPDVPSYADIIEEIRREKAAEQGIEYKPIFFNEPEIPAVEESPVVEEAP